MINEVLPRALVIGLATEMLVCFPGGGGHIFIDFIDGSKIAQMPIERGLELLNPLAGDRGHHYITTIPGVAGNNEPPGPFCWWNKLRLFLRFLVHPDLCERPKVPNHDSKQNCTNQD